SSRMICMFSFSRGSVVVGERQQGEEARALDRDLQLALVARLRARETGRDDLSVVGDEVLQQVDILVIDLLDLLGRETAELLALEQRCLRRTARLLVLGTTTGKSHVHTPFNSNSFRAMPDRARRSGSRAASAPSTACD